MSNRKQNNYADTDFGIPVSDREVSDSYTSRPENRSGMRNPPEDITVHSTEDTTPGRRERPPANPSLERKTNG
jgi:hypothetical protein